MTKPIDYDTILKDAERAVKVAVREALKAQGWPRAGDYARGVVSASEMILHDGAVVTSYRRGGTGC
jgi:hypothetical protein